MGAETLLTMPEKKSASNTGNLMAKFKGNTRRRRFLLNAHMDTVEPGKGITAVFKNGMFTSDGTTILGADDKSAIAILLETLKVLQENDLPYGPIELVLTVCEEIGLLGAKHLDLSLITAKFGYALDATDTEGIVTRAPAQIDLNSKFTEKMHMQVPPLKKGSMLFCWQARPLPVLK